MYEIISASILRTRNIVPGCQPKKAGPNIIRCIGTTLRYGRKNIVPILTFIDAFISLLFLKTIMPSIRNPAKPISNIVWCVNPSVCFISKKIPYTK